MGGGRVIVLLVLTALTASHARAQATAEAAAMTSNSAIAAQAANVRPTSDFSPSGNHAAPISFESAQQKTATSRNSRADGSLIAPSGPPPDEVNRRSFELNAGKDAGKILFRSAPGGAEIFVDHLLVGKTPLLMFMAPGEYEVEMRGSRQETGHRKLGVMPKEVETINIDLSQRYPAAVSIHW